MIRGGPTFRVDLTMIVTEADKLTCARRELKMRESVYPRWVKTGKMSSGKAALEIAIMKAIVADYERKAESERLI